MPLTVSNNSAVATASYYLDKNQKALQHSIKKLASGKRIISPNDDPGTLSVVMKLNAAGRTHVGMKRAHNEDSLRLCRDEGLFIVADGMGGHASGEVASQMSVETLAEFFRATSDDDEITWPYKMEKERRYDECRITTGIKLSNRRIFESASRDSRLKGMGTTIVACLFYDNRMSIAHVGDSRLYRMRNNSLEQITMDHSLLQELVDRGFYSREEAERSTNRNYVTRALGVEATGPVR